MRKSIKPLSPILEYVLLAALAISGFLPVSCKCARENIPLQKTSDTVPEINVRRATMVFGGDVMMHIPQVNAGRTSEGFDFSGTFRHLKPFFDSVDMVMLNLETTIAGNGKYSGYPLFASPPELLDALRDAGVEVLALANNHICDKRETGLSNTVHAIEKAGMNYVGAYSDSLAFAKRNPLIITLNNIRIALMNYTYGTNGMPVPEGAVVNIIDTVAIRRDLQSARKSGVDCSVVYLHWGYEYARKPSSDQEELAEWCHANGADLVIGTHPHVLQPIETRRNINDEIIGITAYSLGNLVSNQRWRYADGGMLLKIDITITDSLPPVYRSGYMLTWVRKNGGSVGFEILPSGVADSLHMSSSDRGAYERFLKDSRKLLDGDHGIFEINYPSRHQTDNTGT